MKAFFTTIISMAFAFAGLLAACNTGSPANGNTDTGSDVVYRAA